MIDRKKTVSLYNPYNSKVVACMSNKIYPNGIQNFEKIRQDGYFYVDKTALMYQMVKTGCYYFLSRPRRLGKSLLISTLEAYFQEMNRC